MPWLGDKAAIKPSSGMAALSSVMVAFFSPSPVLFLSLSNDFDPLQAYWSYREEQYIILLVFERHGLLSVLWQCARVLVICQQLLRKKD